MDIYFDSATWDYSRYNWLCGRGNNTGFPSGMVAPGSGGNYFACNWKNGPLFSVVSMESKPAGWYRATMIITATTHQQKVQNLSTGEVFLGTAELNGTSTIGEDVAFTLFSFGINGYTGAYGSVGMNVSNVKITRNGATIFHLPLSEGHLAVVRDVVSKTAYTIGFFTISAGWAKLADFSHYNFKNGFTLYKKDSNPDIYVPNASDGTEITWTPLLSYVRVANYKGTTTSYNQCESKFKLDDVNPLTDIYLADPDHVLFTVDTGVAKEFSITGMDFNYDRGYLYINSDVQETNFMLYRSDKTLDHDLRVLKYVEQIDRVSYDEETGLPNYDENNHAELGE